MSDHDKWYQSQRFSDTMNPDVGTVNPWYYPVTPHSPYPLHNPNFYRPPDYTPPPTQPYVFHSPQPPPYYTPPTPYTNPYLPYSNGIPWYSSYQHEIQTQPNPYSPPLSCFMSPSVTTTQFSHGLIFEQQSEFVAPEVFDESPESPVPVSDFSNNIYHQMEDKITEILEKIGKNLAESSRVINEMSSKPVSPSSHVFTHVPVVDKLHNKGILERITKCASEDSNHLKLPQVKKSASHMFDESTKKDYVSIDVPIRDEGKSEGIANEVWKEYVDEKSIDITSEGSVIESETPREIVGFHIGKLDSTGINGSSGGMLAMNSNSVVVDTTGFENGEENGAKKIKDDVGNDSKDESYMSLNDDIMLKDIEAMKSEIYLGISFFDVERGLEKGGGVRENVLVINFSEEVAKDGDMNKNGEENVPGEARGCGEDIGTTHMKGLKVTNSIVDISVKEIYDPGFNTEIKAVDIVCDVRPTFENPVSDHESLFGALLLQLGFTLTSDNYGPNMIRTIKGHITHAIFHELNKKFSIAGKKNVLIYDPGGDMFDKSSLPTEKTISGGADVGKRMTAQFLLEHERNLRDIIDDIRALKRVRTTCEQLKRIFSCTTVIKMKSDLVFELTDLYTRITKPGLEVPNRDLFWKYMKPVYRCLKDTKLDKNYIYTIIQNGNSTKTIVAASIISSDKREEKVQEMLFCKYVGGMAKDGSINQNGKEWVAVKIKRKGNWEHNVIVSSHDDVDVVAAVQGGVLPKDANNIIPSKVKPPCIGWVILGGVIRYHEFYLRLLNIDESTTIGRPEFIGSIVNQKVKDLTKRIWCLETEFSGFNMVTGVQLVSKEDMVTEKGMRGTCLEGCKIVPRIDTLRMRGVPDIPAAKTIIHDLQRYVELSPLEHMCMVEIQASDQAALERMYIVLNLSQKYVNMLVEMQKPVAEGKVRLQGIDVYDFQKVGCTSLEVVKNSVHIDTDLDDLDRTFDYVQCHVLNVKMIRIIKASKYSILPHGSAEKKKNYFKGKVRYKCINYSWTIASGDVLQAAIPSDGRNNIQCLSMLDVTLLSLRMGIVRSVRIVFMLKITTIPAKKKQALSTYCDEQPDVKVQVFKYRRRTEDNNLLGVLELPGAPVVVKGMVLSWYWNVIVEIFDPGESGSYELIINWIHP